ncbi:AraC family transcriptional regulator [Bradyrhizobium sp. 41S5]|uniref:helix-turn-helix domain-containing protein n=1 Tax=Bradyrhizobium sp. 41S5 TaxID=1404443 RepID=UPI001E3258F6|nr:AraC family transcriptional regulator [Bradyrhizobium sp. 41S5]UFX45961.1 AraC family transcriptional regulator [Bradyrhizobium sp. 41S5]
MRSRDSEFARDRLFTAFGATGFDCRDHDFGIHANYVRLTSIGAAFCSYDCAASLSFPEADLLRQFFSIQGSANFSTANASEPIGAWSPFISAESRLRLDFSPGYRQLVIRIDAGALERSLKNLLGDASDRKLVFAGDNPDPAHMSFLRHDVFRFAEELERFGADYSSVVLCEMERNLILKFLLAHRHNFSDQLQRQPSSANRAVVDMVEAFIEANWDKPIDIESLARLANVSVRTMFREFALAGRASPGQFAKHVRLQRAAEFLRWPNEQTSVTGVALKCGFQSPGRFASEYLRVIGELPSETLKRSRQRW